jgi:hypothetical protein
MFMGDMAAIRRILSDLSPQEREALNRFYVLGHSAAVVQRDLKMDADELLKLKTKTKARWHAYWLQRKRISL